MILRATLNTADPLLIINKTVQIQQDKTIYRLDWQPCFIRYLKRRGLDMKHSFLIILVICAGLTPTFAHANCWQDAGNRYDIDPLLLHAIAQVESKMNPAARNVNKDGTYDIGLMQVNSRHLKHLATFGISEYQLQTQPCTSVMAGAWILAKFVKQLGYSWDAVGAYNAGTKPNREHLRNRYALRVKGYYGQLVSQREQRLQADARKSQAIFASGGERKYK